MQVSVNKITNCNVFVNGANHCGKAEEAKLPDVGLIMTEHKGLGMIGRIELPGGLDKMGCTIKWTSMYPDVMRAEANPYAANSLQFRGSLETWGPGGRAQEVPVVAIVTGTFKKFPGGSFKQADPVERESELAVSYYKLMVDGKDIVEVDFFANIHKVNGVDVAAKFNQNLGG